MTTTTSDSTVGAPEAAQLRRACAEKIDTYRGGYFRDRPWLREAFLTVPREHFVPDRVWADRPREDGLCPVIDRTEKPGAWLRRVYRPRDVLITQIADGRVTPEDGPTDAEFTSSISCAAVTVDMLHHLDPQPGERVLEIGTGTGYTTALLARRVRAVTSIEIDPGIAARAEKNLRSLELDIPAPLLVVGDGERGHPSGAPYDRILSTAAVQHIPAAWPQQVRAGGVIVTPLLTPFGSDGLCRLVCDGRGGAEGHLIKAVAFMKLRGQRTRQSFGALGWPEWEDYCVTVQADGQRVRTR